MIEVRYTGRYPTACFGDLIIIRNGIEVYNTTANSECNGYREYPFVSSAIGGCWFDASTCEEHIPEGKLVWREDAYERFVAWLSQQPDQEEIADKVQETLGKVKVCCGGCI